MSASICGSSGFWGILMACRSVPPTSGAAGNYIWLRRSVFSIFFCLAAALILASLLDPGSVDLPCSPLSACQRKSHSPGPHLRLPPSPSPDLGEERFVFANDTGEVSASDNSSVSRPDDSYGEYMEDPWMENEEPFALEGNMTDFWSFKEINSDEVLVDLSLCLFLDVFHCRHMRH